MGRGVSLLRRGGQDQAGAADEAVAEPEPREGVRAAGSGGSARGRVIGGLWTAIRGIRAGEGSSGIHQSSPRFALCRSAGEGPATARRSPLVESADQRAAVADVGSL